MGTWVDSDDRQAIHDALEEKGTIRNVEVRRRTKSGRVLTMLFSADIIEISGESCMLSVSLDISDRKAIENERQNYETRIQQMKKMEAIGMLAGGIAHDFNNLLMGIQGRVSLIMADLPHSDPKYNHLQETEKIVKRASELTHQILGFARGGKYEVRTTDLNQLVEKSAEMFARTNKEIKIHKKFAEDLWPVEADQVQIDQVLLNLYVNAWQAMPGGGNLFVQTENVYFERPNVEAYGLKPGPYVKISVTDTGLGMDEETQKRIFDPFFTTKEKERGTGLGLASTYGIIKNHDGLITVDSRKGEGTSFNIFLPSTDRTPSRPKREQAVTEVCQGSGSVLLVDDEEYIRDVGSQMLEKLGYTVVTAKDGEEALDLFQTAPERFDLVLLDLIMPGLGGGAVYDRLREVKPEVKVLLSSGYSIDGQAMEIIERGCSGFIQKPFTMKSLSEKIREVLD
jgi:signal transduction histidine kinase/CheY-like chemotaxis protein